MSKLTEIKIPTTEGIKSAKGEVCFFNVGQKRIKFFLQRTEGSREVFLTDYASGMKIGSLSPIKLQFARSYKTLKNRAAAEILLERIIENHGIERVIQTIESAEKINN